MELYFLRHGIAAEKNDGHKSDAERPLTPEGIKKMKEAVEGMGRIGLVFHEIYSSPYLRAKGTAEIVAEGLEFGKKIKFTESLVPSARIEEFEALLKTFNKNEKYLLVGHEPSISYFISSLVSENADVSIDMKKGGLCRVDVEDLNHVVPGVLKWLFTSRVLRSF